MAATAKFDPADAVDGLYTPSRSLTGLALDLVRPYHKWLITIFFAMLVETIMSLASPWPLKIIIDNVIGDRPLPEWLAWIKELSIGSNEMALVVVAGASVVIIAAIGAVSEYIDKYFTESVAQYVADDLRRRLYHHLHRLSLSFYDTHQIGKLLSTMTSDVSTVQDFTSSTLLNIIVDSLSIAGILAVMFSLNWDFAMVAVGVAPFLFLFLARFKKTVKEATHKVRFEQSKLLAVLEQGLVSMRTVNAFGRQALEEEKLKKISLATVSASLKARRLKSFLSPVVTITVALCIAFVLYRGATLVLTDVMTLGALTVFLAYLNKFFSPVKDLAKLTNTIAGATVALERIQSILDTDTLIKQKPKAKKPGKLKGDIVFDHVFFSYDGKTPVLNDLNLAIKSGQHIGICGPTGSGKSTLASLIPRFYDPTDGRVLIDGRDVRDYQLDGLRSKIGFVLQDTVLFYGSVKENIAYGRPDASEAKIKEAARLANAEEFILKMPHGYDALVGERGLTLSGGQRQRIGIARALIRNAPILILDEPTASIDLGFEKIVLDALEILMKGRTVISLTHRLNTIRNADKIVVLSEGAVVEEGTHEALIAMDGIYAGLYQLQHAPL